MSPMQSRYISLPLWSQWADLGDLQSATAHLLKSVWFSPAEENVAQVDTLSDNVFENRPRMGCLLTLLCIVVLSVDLPFFFFPFLTCAHKQPPTERSVCTITIQYTGDCTPDPLFLTVNWSVFSRVWLSKGLKCWSRYLSCCWKALSHHSLPICP